MSIEMRAALLRQAERLIRTRGYAAFSYADLAASNSIRKASIHHYFPKKEDLVTQLLTEHIEAFQTALGAIESAHPRLRDRLQAYGQHFLEGFNDGMLPLCGALSAERAALPENLSGHIDTFFKMQLGWLARIISEAVELKEVTTAASPDRLAVLLLSVVEGGSLIAWAVDKSSAVLSGFNDIIEHFFRCPTSD